MEAFLLGNFSVHALFGIIIPTLIRILTVWALEYFGPEIYNIAYNVFIGLIVVVFMVFEAAALAVSYKTLAYDRKNT
jgi:hypothetical protein